MTSARPRPSSNRSDEGVSEVVGYIFMFGIGAVVLTFSLQIMTDAQQAGTDLAQARQVQQIGDATASLIQDAARVAQTAPNATYQTDLTLPAGIGGTNYTVQLFVPNEPPKTDSAWEDFWSTTGGCPTNPAIRVVTADDQIESTIRVSNATTGPVTSDKCLVLDTPSEVSSTATNLRIHYTWTENHPTISLQEVNE